MGHSHLQRRRRAFCYRRAKAEVPYRTIQKEEQARYGTANRPVSLSSISRIVATGDLVGDPNSEVGGYIKGLAPRVISAAGKIFYRTTPKLHTITYNGLPDRLAGPPSWATRWACRTARSLPDRLPDRGWSVGQ